MPKVRFTAKAGLPEDKGGKRWLHSKGGRKYSVDGSFRLAEPVYWQSGKSYDVDQWTADWLLACGPDGCFSILEEKPKKKPAPEESKEPEA